MDASLLGGLPSGHARILHQKVFDCLANADQHGLHMLLIKLDLQKAFDKVTIHQALHLMTLMGAPERVVAVLRGPYNGPRRNLNSPEKVSHHPIESSAECREQSYYKRT